MNYLAINKDLAKLLPQLYYIELSDKRVSYVLHDWPNSYECMMVGCRHVESWQRALTVVKEQFRLESLILPERENTLREYSLKAKMCLSNCRLVTDSP